ncbi:putative response regulatory protein [compost metagenome]
MRIIMVDDEELVREGLSKQLRKYRSHWKVDRVFANGRQALDYLSCHQADVMLTDIRMPEMDGLELVKAASEMAPGMKSVILTGYAEFDYAREAIRYGVADYLLKPLEYQSIIELLDRLERENGRSPYLGTMEKALYYIEEHYRDSSLSLTKVADHVNLSSAHFSRMFKLENGEPFIQYLTGLRLKQAAFLLEYSQLKIYEVGREVGYQDSHYFYNLFKKHFEMTPLQYREAKN